MFTEYAPKKSKNRNLAALKDGKASSPEIVICPLRDAKMLAWKENSNARDFSRYETKRRHFLGSLFS